MHRGKRIGLVVLATFAGSFAAGILVMVFCMLVGIACQLATPDDPSAGSAAEILILLMPLGALAGAIAGGIMAWRRTRRPAAGR